MLKWTIDWYLRLAVRWSMVLSLKRPCFGLTTGLTEVCPKGTLGPYELRALLMLLGLHCRKMSEVSFALGVMCNVLHVPSSCVCYCLLFGWLLDNERAIPEETMLSPPWALFYFLGWLVPHISWSCGPRQEECAWDSVGTWKEYLFFCRSEALTL